MLVALRILNGALLVAAACVAASLFRRPGPLNWPTPERVVVTEPWAPDYRPPAGDPMPAEKAPEIRMLGFLDKTVFVRIGSRDGQSELGGPLVVEGEPAGWVLVRFDADSATFRDRAGRELIAKR